MKLELTNHQASLMILAIGEGLSIGKFTLKERFVLRELLATLSNIKTGTDDDETIKYSSSD